jgi:hypothetical protein
MKRAQVFGLLFLTIIFLGTQDVTAQRRKKKKKNAKVEIKAKPKSKKKDKTIKELTKSSKKVDGLFTIYQDTVTGKLQMLIKKEQLNTDYIYFSQIANGVVKAGSFRGAYRGSSVFNIKKYFNKIEFIVPNINYYFDENNALSKSAKANISDANVASVKILAKDDKKGEYLIDANALFLAEKFTKIKPPSRPGSKRKPTLGKFDKNKSKIEEIKSYPENTNIKTEYVYSNPKSFSASSSTISVKVFHTFMNMPDSEYQTRFDDARVGYFTTQKTDMTSTSSTPYHDFINRWRLVKKDPEAAISEPITPITWYLENSTPVEFRDIIMEGVLEWNKAFEKAGFKNAMVVKIQPDDADWDAGDVRYNVLRWTSSPNPPFGGYGPSFVNPKTGEILGADIMLEYVHFTNRVKYQRIFDIAANTESNNNELIEDLFHNENNQMLCSMGHLMHENTMFGQAILAMSGASDLEMKGMKREAMKALIMHEVGHTLGLNHNMKASQLFSPEQLADADFIKGKCLTGSVMDYAAINITNDRSKQGQYYDMSVGPYDIWAIKYGYLPVKTGKELNDILLESTKPELIFGNDADDMRSAGKAIDPRVMTGDMSNDQITYSINRIKLVNNLMKNLKSKLSVEGQSYQQLRNAFYILNRQSSRAGDVISRFIGGVYVDRAVNGQQGETRPYTPVSFKDQKRAMNALSTYVFAPNAFDAPNDLYNYLAKQRRGYNFFSAPEDPKIHASVLSYQRGVLNHILHKNTLQRIQDSELYGNQYKIGTFMTDLNNAIFKKDIYGTVNSFRQNLQVLYTKKLISILDNKTGKSYSTIAKTMALYNLKNILKMLNSKSVDITTRAHKGYLKTLITNTIKEIK